MSSGDKRRKRDKHWDMRVLHVEPGRIVHFNLHPGDVITWYVDTTAGNVVTVEAKGELEKHVSFPEGRKGKHGSYIVMEVSKEAPANDGVIYELLFRGAARNTYSTEPIIIIEDPPVGSAGRGRKRDVGEKDEGKKKKDKKGKKKNKKKGKSKKGRK